MIHIEILPTDMRFWGVCMAKMLLAYTEYGVQRTDIHTVRTLDVLRIPTGYTGYTAYIIYPGYPYIHLPTWHGMVCPFQSSAVQASD